jgi:hypothetical protein
MRFFVVLLPVGKKHIAAIFGDFSANRRADSGASADASHQCYSALQWFSAVHVYLFRKTRIHAWSASKRNSNH